MIVSKRYSKTSSIISVFAWLLNNHNKKTLVTQTSTYSKTKH